jgi:hypothetical protein
MPDAHAYQPTCPKAGYLHHCQSCRVDDCDAPPEDHPSDD